MPLIVVILNMKDCDKDKILSIKEYLDEIKMI